MSRRAGFAALAIVVSALATQPLDAQRPPEGRRPRMQNREQLEQRIRAQMGRLMRERLGLTDEQAVALGEIVEEFEEQRRDLFRQEQETRRRVEELTEQAYPDAEEAAALLERMVSLRAREAALFGEEQEALREVLTPVQILELHALRTEIGQRIRALRSGRFGGERRRGGPLGAAHAGERHRARVEGSGAWPEARAAAPEARKPAPAARTAPPERGRLLRNVDGREGVHLSL